jgi:hypothetical protein
MQHEMLKHYLERAASDTNVEAQIGREARFSKLTFLEAASWRGPISFLREQGVSIRCPVTEEALRAPARRSMKSTRAVLQRRSLFS